MMTETRGYAAGFKDRSRDDECWQQPLGAGVDEERSPAETLTLAQ